MTAGKTTFKPKDPEVFYDRFPELAKRSMITPTKIQKKYREMSDTEKDVFSEMVDIKEGNSYLTTRKVATKKKAGGELKW